DRGTLAGWPGSAGATSRCRQIRRAARTLIHLTIRWGGRWGLLPLPPLYPKTVVRWEYRLVSAVARFRPWLNGTSHAWEEDSLPLGRPGTARADPGAHPPRLRRAARPH